MSQNSKIAKLAGRLLSGAAFVAITAGSAMAQSEDIIVVTSQRQEQSLQDVPLAVSAYAGEDLQAKQIEGFSDIQFNTPNFSFSRSQFTGSSIVIRGVGALAVAADSEPALSVHQNDMPLSSTRLFETEFYDLERLEVLRGPQGTLFGRNATGGVINVITAKADPDGVSASAEAQYGNFQHVQAKGHLNLPLSDTLAVRVAGLTLNRNGYSENIYTGNDIDDRDLYSVRGSLRWLAGENTTVDLVAHRFSEDDNRMRSTKTMCTRDPSGVRGCLPGSLGFDAPHIAGTLNVLASAQLFGTAASLVGQQLAPILGANPGLAAAVNAQLAQWPAAGLWAIGSPDFFNQPLPDGTARNPADFRQVNALIDPRNHAEETVAQAVIRHDFDDLTVKLIGGWGKSEIRQLQQQNNMRGSAIPALNPIAQSVLSPVSLGFLSAGGFPVSAQTPGLAGAIGGDILLRTNEFSSFDLSFGETEYWNVEFNMTSDFDGPFNFLFGANYGQDEGFAHFFVSAPALDYAAVALGSLLTRLPAPIGVGAAQPVAAYVPFFLSEGYSDRRSISVFGEAYVDLSDTLRFTAGVRYNNDEKSVRDRATLLESFLPPGSSDLVPLGTTELRDRLDADPFTDIAGVTSGAVGAINDFRILDQTFEAVTGRAVLEWQPTPDQLYYASYSRGYKPGGANSPATAGLGIDPSYKSEFINAYEIGAKLTGLDGALTANLAAFYYDYKNLQISRIVNRASINDNISATIWGLEGEFVYRPTDNLRLNAVASYLNTEAGEFFAFDPANPTAGQAGVDLYKDISTAANCVVNNNGAPTLVGQLANPLAPASASNPMITPFTLCNELLGPAIAARNTFLGTNYQLSGGIDQNIEGNQLPGSPKWSFNVGMEYSMPVSDSIELTPRVDYYRQGDFYTRPFNAANDLVEGWDMLNMQVTLAPTDGPWYVRGFIQNVLNDDNITGSYLQDQSSGLNYNVFLLEPRRYGVAIGANF